MAEDADTQEDAASHMPGEVLGESLRQVLGSQTWHLDVEEPADEDTSEVPAEPGRDSPPLLIRIVEALLFVGGTPLTPERAAETIRGVSPAQFLQAVDSLSRDYRRQNRPYTIRRQDRGYVLALRPRFQPVADGLYGSNREAKLSPMSIDVLSLVAYRQPATKLEIDGLRGAESGALLRQLVRRGLIAVVLRGDGTKKETSYGTTGRFLTLFGLKSLDDLPRTQDLQML